MLITKGQKIETTPKTIPMRDLPLGKIAVIRDKTSSYDGSLIIRTFDNKFVIMGKRGSNGDYWTLSPDRKFPDLQVEILLPGTLLEVLE